MRYRRKTTDLATIHEVIFTIDEAEDVFKNEVLRILEKHDMGLTKDNSPADRGGSLVAFMSPWEGDEAHVEEDFPCQLSYRWAEPHKSDGRTISSTPPPMPFKDPS